MKLKTIFLKYLSMKNSYTFFFILFLKSSLVQSNELLNNITYFDTYPFQEGHFAQNKNGDLILEYSSEKYRLFFGLKKDGNYFYDNENHYKIITIVNKYNEKLSERYESNNIFISLYNKTND